MDTDSMMSDDLDRLRDRFHERARMQRMPDPDFDRWVSFASSHFHNNIPDDQNISWC